MPSHGRRNRAVSVYDQSKSLEGDMRHLRICFCLMLLATSVTVEAPSKVRHFSGEAKKSAAITIVVDATEAPRGIFHASLRIPVSPGPLTLLYPKFIPGTHSPTGPIVQLVGLRLMANGSPLEWRRDPIDMFTFHCYIPVGADMIDISLDYLSASTIFGSGYGESPNATASLLIVVWNYLLLYPQSHASDDLIYNASLRIPRGWKYATALPTASDSQDVITFRPVSLTTLVDSPVIAGEYFRSVPIADDKISRVQIDMVSDSPGALQLDPEKIKRYRALVAEADALFGSRPFQQYRWLLTLSDTVLSDGIEHHESSDNRLPEGTFLDESASRIWVPIFPHEYVHSWNGKYRCPVGLATTDYQMPMRTELLWVYEGLTRYLGDFVLTTRSGLRTSQESEDYLAWLAANLDNNRPGRKWRTLEDTATAVQILYDAPGEGSAWRRRTDYYDEGLLIWLEVDTMIRQLSHGQRSLDDFCRSFFGGHRGKPSIKPYTFDDLVTALNVIAPYDWRGYFSSHVMKINPRAPIEGIEKSGWKLIYSEVPNEYLRLREQNGDFLDFSFSLGFWLRSDGTILDIVPNLPAAQAGLGPGMKVVSINGHKWSPEGIRDVIKTSKASIQQIELFVQHGHKNITRLVQYGGGDRYPHLEKSTTPDLLSEILKSRVERRGN